MKRISQNDETQRQLRSQEQNEHIRQQRILDEQISHVYGQRSVQIESSNRSNSQNKKQNKLVWQSIEDSHQFHENKNKLFNKIPQNLTKTQSMLQHQKRQIHSRYYRLQDKSYITPVFKEKLYKRILKQMDKHIPIFKPHSKILLIWNFIIIFATLFNLFQVPIALLLTQQVYYSEVNTAFGLVLNISFLVILYIDTFIVRLSISYHQRGRFIQSRVSIFSKYMKQQFWLNLISILSLTIYIISGLPSLIYIKILFYLKLYGLHRIDKQIMHVVEFQRIPYALYRLTKLVIFLWYFTSLAASIYFAIDYYFYLQQNQYYNNGQLWITNSYAVGNFNIIQQFGWFTWYSYALYWALQTASTVGYGDITPMNPPSVLYVIIIILIMTILWAFYVNTIWRIISDLQVDVTRYSDKWKSLINYLRTSSLSPNLKQKMTTYLYQNWKANKGNQLQEQIINKKISKQLKDQFYVEYRKQFYLKINLFRLLSCQIMDIMDAMTDLVYIIVNLNIDEGKIIYNQGDFDPNLYYLWKGQVQLGIKGSKLRKTIRQKENFGVQQFFRRKTRNHWALTQSFSKIWKLNYSQLMQTLNKYIYLNEIYNQLQTKILLDKNNQILQVECWKCQKLSHFLQECPQINEWKRITTQSQSFFILKNQKHHRVNYARRNVKNIKQLGKHIKNYHKFEGAYQIVSQFFYYFSDYNIME